MNNNIKRNICKWTILFLLMFFSIILETTIFSEFRVLGASPSFLPFIVATVALLGGVEEGVITGLVAGILCDALYSGYEGFYTVTLPIFAVLICLMNTVMYWKRFGMAIIDWVVLIIFLNLVRYCIYMLLAGRGSFISVLYVIPGEFVTTLPFTPFIYLVIKKLLKIFNAIEED